jgi:formylglycine-generating enzyme required for sulfatase activity
VPSDEQALPSALAVTQSDDTPPAESGGTETASAAPANETIPAVTAAAATRPAASAAIAAPATAQSSPSASAVPPAASQAVSATKPDRRTNCKVELARTRRPYCIDLRANNKGPALVVLPSGQFEMGGDGKAEQPKHKVDIAHPFAIGMFEVSSAELNAFCKASGQDCPTQPWDDATLPAVGVSWDMARAYTVWLSEYYGARYRLPSEAEWEYAARGGTQSLYAFGDEILPTNAHFSFKSAQDKPLAANDRSLNHNPFRLYHMLGNVREWVADAWTPDHSGAPADGTPREGAGERVVRGGSYADAAAALQSAARQGLAPTGDRYTGFRVVRELD